MRGARRIKFAVIGLALVTATGCGEKSRYVPVSGVVKLNGKPYPKAIVKFQPVGSKDDPNPGRGSGGMTDANGRFVLKTDDGQDGAVIGAHQVKIATLDENVVGYDPAVGSPDNTSTKRPRIDPIPTDWRTLGSHTFDVPAGGTDQANFDIVSPLAPK